MEEKNSLEFLINALMPQTQIKKDEAETKEADKNIYTRQINALSAAIPEKYFSFGKTFGIQTFCRGKNSSFGTKQKGKGSKFRKHKQNGGGCAKKFER